MAISPAPEPDLVDGLVQLSFLVQSVLTASAARHDLTLPQVRLMGILRDREPGMLELARHLGLDKSSVTGLVDRAERRGLVRRTPSAQDGRAVLVGATALGRRLTGQVNAEIVTALAAVTAPLTAAQRRTLAGLAARLLAGPGERGDDLS